MKTLLKAGITLPNGREVITAVYDDIPSMGIVLAEDPGSVMPYATWEFSRPDMSDTYWGRYHETYAGALQDYASRVAARFGPLEE